MSPMSLISCNYQTVDYRIKNIITEMNSQCYKSLIRHIMLILKVIIVSIYY